MGEVFDETHELRGRRMRLDKPFLETSLHALTHRKTRRVRGIVEGETSTVIENEVGPLNHARFTEQRDVLNAHTDIVTEVEGGAAPVDEADESGTSDDGVGYRISANGAVHGAFRVAGLHVFDDGPHVVPRHVPNGSRGLCFRLETNVGPIHEGEEESAVDALNAPDLLGRGFSNDLGAWMMREMRGVHERQSAFVCSLGQAFGGSGIKKRFFANQMPPAVEGGQSNLFASRRRRGDVDRVNVGRRQELTPMRKCPRRTRSSRKFRSKCCRLFRTTGGDGNELGSLRLLECAGKYFGDHACPNDSNIQSLHGSALLVWISKKVAGGAVSQSWRKKTIDFQRRDESNAKFLARTNAVRNDLTAATMRYDPPCGEARSRRSPLETSIQWPFGTADTQLRRVRKKKRPDQRRNAVRLETNTHFSSKTPESPTNLCGGAVGSFPTDTAVRQHPIHTLNMLVLSTPRRGSISPKEYPFMRAPPSTDPSTNTVSTLVLDYLRAEGVNVLFGIPGVALGPLLDELRQQQDEFRYVICRHEGGAAYIADGYSRLSGKLGVVLVTTGPGVTNAFTGAMTAQCGGSSVLVISAEIPQNQFGLGGLQEGIYGTLDVDQTYRAGVQYSAVPTQAANVPTLLTQAIRDAMARPRRAAHVSFSQDLLAASATVTAPKTWRAYRAAPARCSDKQQARIVMEALARAKRPLIMMGNGTREGLAASPERRANLLKMLDHFGLPWFTTGDGKGVLPETHPLSLGSYGMGISVWPYEYMTTEGYAPYDAVLVLGSSLNQNATSPTLVTPTGNSVTPFNKCLVPAQGPFIQVDLDPSVIGRVFPLEMGIVAELSAFIDDLIDASAHVSVNEEIRQQRLELVNTIKTTTAVPPPQLEGKMLQALSAALPTGSHVFIDASTAAQLSQTYMTIDPPTCIHNSLGMAPMGWGLGAAIGGKFAQPQSVCVAILGDGGLLMHGNELSTAAAHGLGVIFVVIHNGVLGTVVNKMKQTYGPGDWAKLYSIGTPQLMEFARSLGAEASCAKTSEELVKEFQKAVEQSARGVPQVIVAEAPVRLSGTKESK